MFERFTERARYVIVLAQDEARTFEHDYIGTEHVLLGVLREEQGLGARVLVTLGITVEEVRAQVDATIGRGTGAPTGMIPFTPAAKKAIEAALRSALSLGHNYIGTEHVLLGLMADKESAAGRILQEFGADDETVRTQVDRTLSSPRRSTHERIGAQQSTYKPRVAIVCCPSCGSSILEAMGSHEPPESIYAAGDGELQCPNCSTSWTAEWTLRMTKR